jgi:hypothetical protein
MNTSPLEYIVSGPRRDGQPPQSPDDLVAAPSPPAPLRLAQPHLTGRFLHHSCFGIAHVLFITAIQPKNTKKVTASRNDNILFFAFLTCALFTLVRASRKSNENRLKQAADKVGSFVGRGFSHDVSALDSSGF